MEDGEDTIMGLSIASAGCPVINELPQRSQLSVRGAWVQTMSRLMIQRTEISCVIVSLMSCSSDVDLASCQSPSGDCDTPVIWSSQLPHFCKAFYRQLLIYIRFSVWVSIRAIKHFVVALF